MKSKLQVGKYYNHNPNHFQFARTYDMGSSYYGLNSYEEWGWTGVILACALIVLVSSGLYCVDFY